MNKKFKQPLIILAISIIAGFTVNAISPNGIPLMFDESRYSTEESDKMMQDFINKPKDTTGSNSTTMMENPNKTKEGFVKPQNIKLDFAKMLFDKNALFIDAREPNEFNAGHVKGAVNVPYKEFYSMPLDQKKDKMKGYNKDGIIVVYCNGGSCEVSIDLAYEIAKIGFNSTNIYLGGYQEWKNAGYPVEEPGK